MELTIEKLIELIQEGGHEFEFLCSPASRATAWTYFKIDSIHLPKAIQYCADGRIRLKQKTVTINGFEVPDDFITNDNLPEDGTLYYLPVPYNADWVGHAEWGDHDFGLRAVERKVAHHTKEGAIAHAMACNGIDPTTWEGEE